jgi:hypothetical protein
MLAGLRIAVDDALLVRFERVGDLAGDAQRFVRSVWALRDAIGQRRALDQLHHQRFDAATLFDAREGRRCWVIERAPGLGLTLEARQRSGSAATADGRTFSATWRFEA